MLSILRDHLKSFTTQVRIQSFTQTLINWWQALLYKVPPGLAIGIYTHKTIDGRASIDDSPGVNWGSVSSQRHFDRVECKWLGVELPTLMDNLFTHWAAAAPTSVPWESLVKYSWRKFSDCDYVQISTVSLFMLNQQNIKKKIRLCYAITNLKPQSSTVGHTQSCWPP